ncbi:hypothetical protein [Hymenobacter sp. BRD67]|uniref:hypothetical protein n=1 Tax=Hymenobacter sp. BRD67 TaxID=2675877 RepID=UPI0015659F80|nr:hypothetical protein [Hymenobacter sp. BRD67]QKG54888.1 hypothetical protein GKZ67_20895 [Hymenobacter sp. BRD67]
MAAGAPHLAAPETAGRPAPRIGEARLVWAEPLAEGELLNAFGRTLRHETLPGQTKPLAPAEADVLTGLLRSVAAHTRLVGEAGWLVPLEQELSGLIEAARLNWSNARAAVAQAAQVDMFRGAPAQQLGLPSLKRWAGCAAKHFLRKPKACYWPRSPCMLSRRLAPMRINGSCSPPTRPHPGPGGPLPPTLRCCADEPALWRGGGGQ